MSKNMTKGLKNMLLVCIDAISLAAFSAVNKDNSFRNPGVIPSTSEGLVLFNTRQNLQKAN